MLRKFTLLFVLLMMAAPAFTQPFDDDDAYGSCPPTDPAWPTCVPEEDGDGSGGGGSGEQACCVRYRSCLERIAVLSDLCIDFCDFLSGEEEVQCIDDCTAELVSDTQACGHLHCGTIEPSC